MLTESWLINKDRKALLCVESNDASYSHVYQQESSINLDMYTHTHATIIFEGCCNVSHDVWLSETVPKSVECQW